MKKNTATVVETFKAKTFRFFLFKFSLNVGDLLTNIRSIVLSRIKIQEKKVTCRINASANPEPCLYVVLQVGWLASKVVAEMARILDTQVFYLFIANNCGNLGVLNPFVSRPFALKSQYIFTNFTYFN